MSEKPQQAKNGVSRLLERIPERMRGVLAGVVAVLLLAGVIVAGSALSAPKSTPPPETKLGATTSTDCSTNRLSWLCSRARRRRQSCCSSRLSRQTPRISRLEGRSKSPAPDSQRRRPLPREWITGAAKPAPAEPKAEDPAFSKPTDDLAGLLPRFVDGYALGQKSALGDDATVSGTANGSDLIGSRAQWSVHYRKTDRAAKSFVDKVSKSLYPKNAKTLQIDGSTAYFGTDGTRFATVVYVRGRYVFEVVLTSLDGQAVEFEC